MKKLIFMGILGLFILGSCNSKSGGNHEGHDHGTEAHDHEHEAHDHEHEGHDHEHEGEDHEHEGEDHEGHDHEGDEHSRSSEPATGHSDEIILPKAKAEAAGVKTSIIEPEVFEQVIKTSGQVLAAQGDESVAVATVAGVVSFRGKVTEGMSVGKGTALVTISSSNIADGDPVQRARIAYDISRKEYERMQALVKNKIVSDKEFAQAEQNYENARISYEALAKNHSAGGQAVTSPISGFVKNILVKEGDYVTIGQPLVSITQNRRLFLRAEVSEKYYPSLRTIGSDNFKTPYDNKVYELKELNGRLLSFGKSAGENSFYVPVTFEFDNKGDIIPGSFVEVYLLSSPMENVLSLPRTALTEEQGLFFAYLQLDEEGYKKQEVTLGADNGKSVQVLSGIKAGDRVVTQGAYQVKLASASNAIPAHSHEH
ncbi:efflux transporter, RND family, MFP subunit [Bacteroides fragilis str. 1007-1-F |uniref:Efflux transporter, RND family, MFP subunit n=1 Tax=Bacteroides fragilis str. 1007-1-F \|nr:efflux RND transporter periplasmic adaptor subunit [Bacteroides fragilis]EXY11766.1 efflux transporter, RND family, MFP subunit [Bacteroides fragilis str. 1007-1-F \